MNTVQKHKAKWSRRKDARPQEIIDAALKLFAVKGFAATRLDDVAKEAGISKGTLYLYFSDKEALFKQVVQGGMIDNIAPLEQAIKAHTGSAEDLLRMFVTHMTALVTTTPVGAIPKLIISEAGNFPNVTAFYRDEVVFRIHKTMVSIIKKGVADGEFRQVPLMEAARSLLAPIFMLALAVNMPGFKEKLEMNPAKQAEVTLDIWLKGMRP
ncbi:MAG: TetR/AcrR family transcriptional regulator [Sphingomonadales bacterium]|nr:TetR/AcrR family transcriptional regulator [Sphingomonadales bacterium]